MKISDILSKVDHTYLKQDAVWQDIKRTCDEGALFSCASVCIPPSFVKAAKEYMGEKIKICTVTGFPNGYSTSEVKVYEAACAVRDGADEIDMVINIGMLKDGRYSEILDEINLIKSRIGDRVLKVIIEACLLTEEEKLRICDIVADSAADFIKTSTGFSTSGATAADVKLLSDRMAGRKRVKAAGGIKSLSDAEEFISLGAARLGTSRLVSIAKSERAKSDY